MTHVSPPERDALADLESWGLVDAFRTQYPDDHLFSWWDYRGGSFHRHRGMRIDLILVTEVLARNTTFALIDRQARKGEKPSDHTPVFIDTIRRLTRRDTRPPVPPVVKSRDSQPRSWARRSANRPTAACRVGRPDPSAATAARSASHGDGRRSMARPLAPMVRLLAHEHSRTRPARVSATYSSRRSSARAPGLSAWTMGTNPSSSPTR